MVAPALVADAVGGSPTLGDFPDWLDWPATLAALEVGIEFDVAPEMSVIGLVIQPDERSSKLWRQLFPPDTPVIPFEAPDDLASRPVMTFSGSTVIDSLRRSYTQTALDAVDDLPVIAPPAPGLAAGDEPPFADFFAAVGDPANQFLLTADDQTFATTMASLVAGAGRGDAGMVEVLPGGQGSTGEIVRTMAFHRGPGTVTEPETDDEQRREAVHESIDFHRMLTGLNEHPTMLRRLGLVFDIAVEIRSTGTQTGRARFQPSWTPQLTATTDRPLWVAWRLDLAATQPFAAATAGPPGVLDVGAASAYRHRGAGARQRRPTRRRDGRHHAGRRCRRPGPRRCAAAACCCSTTDTPKQFTPTSARQPRARGASRPTTRCAPTTSSRGYRFDVLDTGRDAWFSLHERRTDYRRDGTSVIEPVSEEGAHHPTVTSRQVEPGTEPAADSAVFIHEAVVRWDGWSLSAPRPGRSLAANITAADLATPADITEQVTNDPLMSLGPADRDVRAAGHVAPASVRHEVPDAGAHGRPRRQRVDEGRGRRPVVASVVDRWRERRHAGADRRDLARGSVPALRTGRATGHRQDKSGARERLPPRGAQRARRRRPCARRHHDHRPVPAVRAPWQRGARRTSRPVRRSDRVERR